MCHYNLWCTSSGSFSRAPSLNERVRVWFVALSLSIAGNLTTAGLWPRLPDRVWSRCRAVLLRGSSGSFLSAVRRAGRERQTGDGATMAGVCGGGLDCDRTIFSGLVTVIVGRCASSGVIVGRCASSGDGDDTK